MKQLCVRNLKIGLLAILPIVFAIISILLHFISGKSFLQRVDPEYLHLFNGLNIAIGNLAVEYIAHPGTSIQLIFGVSANIVNLFMPGSNLIAKALDNPELFIHAANILMNLLTAISIFCLGYYAYRHSKNYLLAILLQLIPFGTYKILMMSSRIIPETVLVAPFLLLILLIIKYIYDDERLQKEKQYLIGFAIVGGLGMAGKLSYLPFLLPPLFMFSGLKIRLKYILFTIIATMVFAFPLLVNLSKAWDWFFGMFMHSGRWGEGENNIVNLSAFPENIHKLIMSDIYLAVFAGLAFLQAFVFYILNILKIIKPNKLMMRIMISFLAVYTLSVLLVAKHFAMHYFTPFLLLKIVFIVLMIELAIQTFKQKSLKQILPALGLITALFIVAYQVPPLKANTQKIISNASKFEKRLELLKPYNDNKNNLIISSHFRGSPFIQSAFNDGFLISGFLKSTYIDELKKRYPTTYFSLKWTDDFYHWDDFLNASDFIDPLKKTYIFIGEGNEKDLNIILGRIKSAFPDYDENMELVEQLEQPREYLYQLDLTQKAKLVK